jgi:diaminopimelate epimerase
MIMDFHKYHALGNDYIVIDPRETQIELTPDAIRMICDRNRGVGSDGILFGPIVENDKTGLRIFNPDGSEAEKSGNGIRIFSKYLIDAGYAAESRFELTTRGGPVSVEILDEKANRISVDMGTVTFRSIDIPVIGPERDVVDEDLEVQGNRYRVTCLSIGNPHCIIPVPEPTRDMAVRLGPYVERHQRFPNRINMQLVQVIDRNAIRIEIWERGAGYTAASGSSSCAAASAMFRLGKVDRKVAVRMPGGVIDILIREDGHVLMTGEVAGVMSGWFHDDLREKLEFDPGSYNKKGQW